MSLNALSQFFTNGTFAQETIKTATNGIVEAAKSTDPYVATAALSLGGVAIGAAYAIKKRGAPTLESMRGHAAYALSYLDPREYTAAARERRKPKVS